MPDPKAWRLPEPENDADFEVLCLDLYKAMKKPTIEPERFGRKGQKQYGLDFVLDLEHGLDGYQCKCTRSINLAVVEEELAETGVFPGTLSAFTVLTTAPRDTKLQMSVYALSQARRKQGQFPVGIVFWESLCDLLAEHIDVLKMHFAQLVPDLDDLLQARARRLDREFPGTTVSFHVAPGRTEVTLHPGPEGVPMSGRFAGKDVIERFEGVIRTGKPATFGEEELFLHLPEAVDHALGRRPPAAGDVRTLTITPSINGAKLSARLLVQPASKYPSMQMFLRRGRRSAEGIPTTVTVVEAGTDRYVLNVVSDVIPVFMTLEHVGAKPNSIAFHRPYVGRPVAQAVASERLLQDMVAGAYVGVFAGKAYTAFRMAPDEDRGSPLAALESLAELADLADWDILVPEAVSEEEAMVIDELTGLFRHGRRVAGYGGGAHVVVHTHEGLQQLRDFLTGVTGQLSSLMEQDATDIELVGQSFLLPAMRRRAARIEISDADAALVMAAEGVPLEIDLVVPDDVELVEELVEPDQDE